MRVKRRTEMVMMRLTPREKAKFERVADQLELPASEIMRLSMRAGLAKVRRQFAEPQKDAQ